MSSRKCLHISEVGSFRDEGAHSSVIAGEVHKRRRGAPVSQDSKIITLMTSVVWFLAGV